MTLKYESELLFDLMKRDGDDTPSDVLPYESELKEKYLNQVVGAYPKLQDYRPEWLNYNLYHHLPSEFPIESVANVTSASFNNVVPYAYKSAILKGNSEVVVGKNKCNMEKIELGWLHNVTGAVSSNNGVFIPVEVSGTITISNYIHTDIRYVYEYDANGKYLGRTQVTTDIVTLDLTQNTTLIKIGFYNGTLSTVKSLELQVEQGEIASEYEPYNPTLVSVKMPVLTTSNEDGTKTNILTVNEEVELRGIGEVQDELNLLTGELTQRIGEYSLDGSGKWTIRTDIQLDGYIYFQQELDYILQSKNIAICERLPYFNETDILSEQLRLSTYNNGTIIGVRLSESKGVSSLGEFIEYLKTNPIKFKYPLATESIKTVDLTVTDQDGITESNIRPIEGTMHVNTSSQTLPPLLDMSVPVEATTQNLMSFANIEGEE